MSWGSQGRAAASSVLVLVLLGGCSQQAATRDDLINALRESHSALVAARIALETLHRHRTTSAATEIALQDMSQEIADAAYTLGSVDIGSGPDQADRDLALAAVSNGEAALLTARDQFDIDGQADPAPLAAATNQVDRAVDQIRGRR